MYERSKKRLLLLTPPLLQPNTPFPATMHLAGFLKSRGFDVAQRDLSIKVVRDVLLEYGDETTGELLEFLGGPAPVEAKRGASEAIEDLALSIRDQIDPDFGFSRYAEHLCRAVTDFGELERLIRRRGVIDKPLERRLKAAMEEVKPSVVGVTCPFPGTLVAAFKIARYIKRRYPGVRLVLGGGYVSTELREMTDRRPYKYFDEFQLDEGYAPFAKLLGDRKASAADVPLFVKPDYAGIDWSEYFDVAETDNFVTNLWNCGKWVKLVMARGCYWRKCAFCDVKLPYIGCFKMPKAAEIVDAMEEFFGRGAAPSDGAAAASGSSDLAALAAAIFALATRLQPTSATKAARPNIWIFGKPGMSPMQTIMTAPRRMAFGCAKNWLTMSCPSGLFFSSPTRVTMTPDVIDTSSAGICETRPSPTVRMPYLVIAHETSLPFMNTPMQMPPTMLIAVMMRPATASPFTNFIAPSIAP